MQKLDLSTLFVKNLFRIPDYQRGYAWEEKQLNDFIEDIDALVEDNFSKSHYTGTIVVFVPNRSAPQEYGTKRLPVADVVDGQQRLTTSCLYLSVILRRLADQGVEKYARETDEYLYSGTTCKLTLNNNSANLFFDLLRNGSPNTPPQLPHEKRLVASHALLAAHVDAQIAARGATAIDYLKNLHGALTQRLQFTFYEIEEECEIGMTFELMNSRGKGLSVLELLKNYLMHWISRNAAKDQISRLTSLINKNWTDTYRNLGECDGDEDQCLRVAWTLYCDHVPGNWSGYEGFKHDKQIPLRNFRVKSREEVERFIQKFADSLAEVSVHYSVITKPTESNTLSADERRWLQKILNTGNIANFLPLLVAARKNAKAGLLDLDKYIALLQSLECYAYRVYLHEGRRSNAGKSSFHTWAWDLLRDPQSISGITANVHNLARYYQPDDVFKAGNEKIGGWYENRRLLKYTLYEYELHLLVDEGKNKTPSLTWEQLGDSTIEHILPQTPEADSHWRSVWTQGEMEECVHDIGNLVLTQSNSHYRNFDFARKRGVPGQSPAYFDSDIRQERRVARYSDWTRKELMDRRSELTAWIGRRWKTDLTVVARIEENEERNEDGTQPVDTMES